MTRVRHIAIATAVAVGLSGLTAVRDLAAQATGEILVLVAPLKAGPGVSPKFGEKVAEEVAKALENFSGMVPVKEGEVKKALKEFNLDPQQMNLIQWRQLGSRMNVQLVMYGTAEARGGGVEVQVTFVDPKSGDELPVPTFAVANDGQSRQAADHIAEGLERQVAYQRSVLFCAEYLASDQIDDALRNCNQALQVNPSSVRALYLRGRTYMEAEEWEKAVEDLEKVVEESPSNTDALQSLAYAHAQLGNSARSQELYQEYLTFQPDDAQVRLNVAFQLAQAGAYEAAAEILKQGLARDSTNVALWEYLGSVALAAGTGSAANGTGNAGVTDTASVRLAVRAFDKVLALKGDSIDPAILRNAIAANLEIGELDAALEFSERALAALRASAAAQNGDADGESRAQILAGIHSLRADIFRDRGQLDRAIQEMNQVIEADPSYPNAYLKRGFLRLRAGNMQGALADYRRAVSEEGQDPNAIANQLFGTAYNDYFQKGDYGTAINMFRTALDFAQNPELRNQINFFTAYGYFQWGSGIDRQNEQQEACEPARRALSLFQNVGRYLSGSGNYQAGSQAQIREATDVQLFRQEQIIKAKCR